MKTQVSNRITKWIAYMAVLVVLAYSVVAFNTAPAYASSCNCTNDYALAEAFCYNNYGDDIVSYYSCPEDLGGTPGYWFNCLSDPNHWLHTGYCDQYPFF